MEIWTTIKYIHMYNNIIINPGTKVETELLSIIIISE